MFQIRIGHSKTGKGCSKTDTNKIVHKLNGKIRVEKVAYILNFKYKEIKNTKSKFTIGFAMVGKLRVKSPCVPQKWQ